MKKKTTIILLTLILSIYTLNINVQISAEENNYRPTSLELTPHNPISITSDSGLEVFPGSGTAEDPYLIEGYNITTTSTNGIYIYGTTKFFVVRNCYVDAEENGIFIGYVADGTATIENNTCEKNSIGIALGPSGSSTVANNTCNNNIFGIWIVDSDDSTITNNTCENNYNGISLWHSGSATVINNTCSDNEEEGIFLLDSGSVTVANNTFTNCGLDIHEDTIDAYLSYSVENNWVNGKKLGFYTNLDSTTIAEPIYGQLILVNCIDVIVRDQILNSATIGLSLNFCTDSIIINNTCTNNREGILLVSSGSATVENNTCNNNNRNGITLVSSGSTTVTNNMCSNNNWCGIWLDFSSSSIIADNTCNNNDGGIFLYFSESVTVTNNTFTNCGLDIYEDTIDAYLSYSVENNWVNGKKLGFYTNLDSTTIAEPIYGQLILINCTNVTVRDQILDSTTIGLFLYSCTDSTINNNTCNNNDWDGIALVSSRNSTVTSNTCSNNGGGIRLDFSDFCIVTYNLLQENRYGGIYLSSGSDDNLICYNNFEDNNLGGTSQARDDGSNNYWYDSTTQGGNYWSDWSGGGSYSIDGEANSEDLYPLDEPAEYTTTEHTTVESTTDENRINFMFTLLILVVPLMLTRIISKKTKK